MDDALLMGCFESLGDLLGDGASFVDGDRPLLDAVRQRRALDQFQNQRPDALSLLQPVDGADVGMVQRGEHLGLPLEARQPAGVLRERLGQYLEGHVPVELRVASLIDLAHPTFADFGGDLIRAERGAGFEWHQSTRTSRFSSSNQFVTAIKSRRFEALSLRKRKCSPSSDTS